ncbi:amidase [Actinomadura litoris]|uniref:amidase n=1 Tax=Actinomadura litoris TaxID=2678616 RepID=UPI001FA7EC6D|nr:amidase [Actinomadura litoris]
MGGFFAGRTLADLGAALRAGTESASGLLERALESVDPSLNAFVTLDEEGAAVAARQADEELGSSADRGPLHGIPVAVKDIIDVAGLPTGMGSAHFAGHTAEHDAAVVTRLRTAGAVIVGKTGTHEFAYGGTGDVSADGPCRNPRDPARMSGGSSSGSAVAVAAGTVPLAIGTDTGGSVRIPAAFCGITGFKPRFGAIPTGGVFPLARSFDHVGVLAGTPADCRTAYRVLAGLSPEPREPFEPFEPFEPRPEPGGSVAWIEPQEIDPDVERAVAGTVRAVFPDAVSEKVDLKELRRVFAAIQDSEAYEVHAERVADAPELFQRPTLERLERAGRTPGWRYVRAERERAEIRREVEVLLGRHDLLVLPTMPITAPPIGTTGSDLGPLTPLLISLTCAWNVLGLPAISVPAGTVGGLPVAAQLVTRPGAEDLLFAAAERLRSAPR